MGTEPRAKRAFPPGAAEDLRFWALFLLGLGGMFALSSLLRDSLGEFWSLAIFLPIWAALHLLTHLLERWMEARHDRA